MAICYGLGNDTIVGWSEQLSGNQPLVGYFLLLGLLAFSQGQMRSKGYRGPTFILQVHKLSLDLSYTLAFKRRIHLGSGGTHL